jgi:hypothetical protein
MRYFIDGMEAQQSDFLASFIAESCAQGVSFDDAFENWKECLESEDARDCYLPSHMEIVA